MDGHLSRGLPPERGLERLARLDRPQLGADLVDRATKRGTPPTRSNGPGLDRAPKLRGAMGEPGRRQLGGRGPGSAETEEATTSDVQAEGRLDDHVTDGRPIT